MKSDEDIAKQFRKHKGVSDRGLSQQWQNTRDCQAFYAGNFMEYTDSLIQGDVFGRSRNIPVQFSLVKPYVNSVRGFMAQNRANADYIARLPLDQGQQMYSQYVNALKDYVRENANADQVETQQDGDNLICGYGAVETAMSYGEGYSSRNPNGEIIFGRLDPRDLGWDPTARQSNLLDARYIWYRRIYALDEALELFDDADKGDFEEADDTLEAAKVYNPNGGKYDKIQDLGSADSVDWEDEDDELVRVYFYQWYEIETFYRAPNPLANIKDPQMLQFAQMELEDIAQEQEDVDEQYALDPRAKIISCDAATKREIMDVFEDEVEFEPFKRRVYYTAVVSGDKVFTSYRNRCQQGFTVKFKTGDYDESNKMWVGMVNSLRDPVMYYNKALTELMVLIASQAKGGAYVEEGALAGDIRDFEDKYAQTDAVIMVADGAISGNKIQPKKESFSDGGLNSLIQLSEDAIDRTGGIDRGFFSATGDANETATLQRQRIKQAMTILATYMDNIQLFKKEQSALLLPMMRELAENNDGSLFKSIADDGTIQFLQMNPESFADEYDISIQEAPESAMQKAEQATTLAGMATVLISAQDFDSAKKVMAIQTKYLNLDFEDQQEIMNLLSPPPDPNAQAMQEQQQQLEQQMAQLKVQDAEATVKDKMSRAGLNLIAGQEKISGIRKNNAIATQTNVETRIIQRQPIDKTQDVRVNA